MKIPKHVKITRSIGDWTAEVEGVRLAVLHNTQRVGRDGFFMPFDTDPHVNWRYQKFEDALYAQCRAVVQIDASPTDYKCMGYVGVFCFTKLLINPSGISLHFTKKYAESSDKPKRRTP